ncbi:MAG: DegV family protein [Acidimicrobiales bacterium]
MIGLVTDSNSQIPPELAARYGVEVVPLTVTVDGVDYLEGVDMDADQFYARFDDRTPAVSTSQPSPGRFSSAYRAMADRGVDEILSIHIGSSISGTVNSARLASEASPVPVRIVDTGTASFAITCCLWEAAEALARGATLEEAAGEAERVSALAGNVFVVRALDIARSGGRLAEGASAEGVPVLSLAGGAMQTLADVTSFDEAAETMAGVVRASGTGLRVGIGVADAAAAALGQSVEDRLSNVAEVRELVRYRCGPSVGAHTGPGTVGAMYYPSRA